MDPRILKNEYEKNVKSLSFYVSGFTKILKLGSFVTRKALSVVFVLGCAYLIFNTITFIVSFFIFAMNSTWLAFASTVGVGMVFLGAEALINRAPTPVKNAIYGFIKFAFSITFKIIKTVVPYVAVDMVTIYEFVSNIISTMWNGTQISYTDIVDDKDPIDILSNRISDFSKRMFNYLVDMFKSLLKKIYDNLPEEYKGKSSTLNDLITYFTEMKEEFLNAFNKDYKDSETKESDEGYEFFDGELHINYNSNKEFDENKTKKTIIKNGVIVDQETPNRKIIKIKGTTGFRIDLDNNKNLKQNKPPASKKKNEIQNLEVDQTLNDDDLEVSSKKSVLEYQRIRSNIESVIKNNSGFDNTGDGPTENISNIDTAENLLRLFDPKEFLDFMGMGKELIEFEEYLSGAHHDVLSQIKKYFDNKNTLVEENNSSSAGSSTRYNDTESYWDTGNDMVDDMYDFSSRDSSNRSSSSSSSTISGVSTKPNIILDDKTDQIFNFLLSIYTEEKLMINHPDSIKPIVVLGDFLKKIEKEYPEITISIKSGQNGNNFSKKIEGDAETTAFITKITKIVMGDESIDGNFKESIKQNEKAIPVNFDPIFSNINFVSDINAASMSKFMALFNLTQRSMNHMFAEQSMYLSNSDTENLHKGTQHYTGMLADYLQDEFTGSDAPQFTSSVLPNISTREKELQNIRDLTKKYKYPLKNLKRPAKIFTDIYSKDRDLLSLTNYDETENYDNGPPSLYFQFGVAYVSDFKKNSTQLTQTQPAIVDKDFWEETKKRYKEKVESGSANNVLFSNKKKDERIFTMIRLVTKLHHELFARQSSTPETSGYKTFNDRWFRLIEGTTIVKPTFSNSYIKKLNTDSIMVRPEDLNCGFDNCFMSNSNVTQGSLDNNYNQTGKTNSPSRIFNVDSKNNGAYNKKTQILKSNMSEINKKQENINSDIVIQNYIFSDPYLETPQNLGDEFIITNTIFSRSLMMKYPVDLFGSIYLEGKGGDVMLLDINTIERYSEITEKIRVFESTDKFHKVFMVDMDLGFIMTNKNVTVHDTSIQYSTKKVNPSDRDTHFIKIPGSKIILQYIKSSSVMPLKENELEKNRNLYAVTFVIDIQSLYRTLVTYDVIQSFGIYRSPISRWTKLYSYHSNTIFSGVTSGGVKTSMMTINNIKPQARFIFTTFMDTLDRLNLICLSLFKGYSKSLILLEQFVKFHNTYVTKNRVGGKKMWEYFSVATKKLVRITNDYSHHFKNVLEYLPNIWEAFKEIGDKIFIDRSFQDNWVSQLKTLTPELIKTHILGEKTKLTVSKEALVILGSFLANN